MQRETGSGWDQVGRIGLLNADPELGASLSPDEFAEATHRCSAALVRRGRGPIHEWRASGSGHDLAYGLVVRGLVSRRILVEDGHAVELFGPGDLLRPWTGDEDMTVRAETRWRVQDPAMLAVLDRRFFVSASRWPVLHAALLERSARCSRSLLVRLAIAEIPLVARRVHLVLWHLAERWGSVVPTGVVLRLHLSRTALADLVCARRESVSRALRALADRDLVHPDQRGFLLRGRAPEPAAAALKVVISVTRPRRSCD